MFPFNVERPRPIRRIGRTLASLIQKGLSLLLLIGHLVILVFLFLSLHGSRQLVSQREEDRSLAA